MEEIRLLIVSDDPFARSGLAMSLADLPGCLLVGQMSSEEVTRDNLEVDWVNDHHPDVIIWDLGWDVGGELPDWQDVNLPVVALLPEDVQAVEVWAAGGRALLRRDMDADKLLAAVQAVVQGLAVLDPGLAHMLLPTVSLNDAASAGELTPRELEVLQLLAEGLTNKAIAQRLEISDHTVKFHVNAIMGKLGAQSRTEAVVRATRLGLILL